MVRRGLRATAIGVTAVGTAMAGAMAVPTATAQPASQVVTADAVVPPGGADRHGRDDLPHPLGDKQRALKREALDRVVRGEAAPKANAAGDKVVQLGRGQYVDYQVERTEQIFTVLAEFGDKTHSAMGGTKGPKHNEIVKPDRVIDGQATDDNSTIWRADFNRAYFLDLMFGPKESFKDFYLKQSGGRFLADGDVSEWVTVPYNEARYGHNPVEGDGTSESEMYWAFVTDTVTAWYDAQKAAGKSDAEITTYLKRFDQVDRYDWDQDGNFKESDGYIDHFQAVHAGEGEEAKGGAQGADAIWSHRWYAHADKVGRDGPGENLNGGVQIGNTGIWVGDYTTEPENGGLGVFVHEFGHDLGLPDLYDTSGGENAVGFWSLMSAGSWLGDGKTDIGSKPGYLGAWEKLYLGWLDHKKVAYGANTKAWIGPADQRGTLPQALLVTLPDRTKTEEFTTPYAGKLQWWSGQGNSLNHTLTRTVDLTGKTSASVSAWVATDTEADYDMLYVEASTDGKTWEKLLTVDGQTSWTQRTVNLADYAGTKVEVRFRYATDGGKSLPGVFLDDIVLTVDGAVISKDGAEDADGGWTAKGFTRMDGTVKSTVTSYYLAENRVYSGYDRYLKTGPYNFGWLDTQPKRVEHFPYQNGLLVWYSDGMCTDNNTKEHPGCGLALPVDARPTPITFPDGTLLTNRRQPFDATFGRESTDAVSFHLKGVETKVGRQPAIKTFDDSQVNRYWVASNPQHSTKVAGTGTSLTVSRTAKSAQQMLIDVRFAKK